MMIGRWIGAWKSWEESLTRCSSLPGVAYFPTCEFIEWWETRIFVRRLPRAFQFTSDRVLKLITKLATSRILTTKTIGCELDKEFH